MAVQNNFINNDLAFINVDLIAQNLGGYTEENYARAFDIYRETVKELIDSGKDFMIESNLADSRSYEWVSLMKKQGYKIILYYLSTDDVTINIGRVEPRVAEGGHNIPEAIVKSRYSQSHSYLKTKIFQFNEVYLIDNSSDTAEVQFQIAEDAIVFKATELHTCIKDVISIFEKVSVKKVRK